MQTYQQAHMNTTFNPSYIIAFSNFCTCAAVRYVERIKRNLKSSIFFSCNRRNALQLLTWLYLKHLRTVLIGMNSVCLGFS